MALTDYVPETRQIPLGNTAFEVRGLTLEDMAILIRTHLPHLEAVVDLIKHNDKIEPSNVQDLIASMVSQAPGLAANIIALAAGETNAQATAARLPALKQIEALQGVFELTFSEVGSVKKVFDLLLGLMKQDQVAGLMKMTKVS